MSRRDPRIDAYIKKAAPFAQPILTELRAIVHDACPGVGEDIKWRFPHFLYHGMLCSMASFTRHAAFSFWKGALVTGGPRSADAMGHLGRLTTVSDLPPKKVLAALIRKAARLNEQGVKVPRVKQAGPATAVRTPADLAAALKKNPGARRGYNAFSPSHKRDYIEWITEAKTDETRVRRLRQALEWMADGKSRNWKYERK
jgi:uncharacterized protein YdeI (YjbR/CyaY-like superfamily)